MFKFVSFLVAAAALTFAPVASAHSKLQSSTPANGATVAEAKSITLTFTQEVRLVTVKLKAKDLDSALPVDRAAPAAKSFAVTLPATLGPSAYDVAWTASAADGHVMTGSFSFTIAPAAKP